MHVSRELCDLPWRQGLTVTLIQEHVFTFQSWNLFYAGESFANEVFAKSKLVAHNQHQDCAAPVSPSLKSLGCTSKHCGNTDVNQNLFLHPSKDQVFPLPPGSVRLMRSKAGCEFRPSHIQWILTNFQAERISGFILRQTSQCLNGMKQSSNSHHFPKVSLQVFLAICL